MLNTAILRERLKQLEERELVEIEGSEAVAFQRDLMLVAAEIAAFGLIMLPGTIEELHLYSRYSVTIEGAGIDLEESLLRLESKAGHPSTGGTPSPVS